MKKNILTAAAVIIVIVFISAVLLMRQSKQPAGPQPSPSGSSANTVIIQDFTFTPAVLTVKKGTTVTWINQDSAPHQVASDPHPTHTDLPGLVSDPFGQGQSYSFTFDKAGTFGYHCHIHPTMKGTIVVE